MRVAGLAVALMSLGLASCLQIDEAGTYSVEQIAVFEDGGRTIERRVRVRCSILRYAHGPEGPYSIANPSGPPIWLERADGSLLLIEHDDPCAWTEIPEAGATDDLLPDPDLQGLLFDQAERPHAVEQLDVLGETSGLRLVSLSAVAGPDAEPDLDFERVFPGWESSRGSGGEARRWVTVWTQARPLPPGACAGEAPTFIPNEVTLPACAEPGAEEVIIWAPMEVQADAGYDRVDLSPLPEGRRGPQRFPLSGIRRAGGPFLRGDDRQRWAPQVCVGGFCISGAQALGGGYILTADQLISVSVSDSALSYPLETRLAD